MDEEQIITLFFARSEQAIEALDAKYGKAIPHKCHNPHYTTGAK